MGMPDDGPSGGSPAGRVLAALEAGGMGVQAAGAAQWKSRCPAHGGRSRNLSIREEPDGTVLLHCHRVDESGRGCSAKEVVQAIGLQFRDLFPPRLGTARPRAPKGPKGPGKARPPKAPKKPPRLYPTPEKAIEGISRHLGEPVGCWPYHELHEGQRFEIMRIYRFDVGEKDDGRKEKEFRPVHADAGGWALGDPPGKLPLYCLPELGGDEPVYVLEGEKCANLGRGLGLVATTSAHGSKGAHKTDWTPLAGRRVTIVADGDGEGKGYALAVGEILLGLSPPAEVRVLDLPGLGPKDDIEQWLERLPDSWSDEDCRREIERLAQALPPWTPPPREVPDTPTGPGKDGYNLTEWGNAQRLVRAHGDKLRYCHNRGLWLAWDGRRWEPDSKARIWSWTKDVIRQLGREAAEATDSELRERTLKWALASERKKIIQATMDLAWSEPGIGVVPSELDRDPWALNCPNGTVDLRTGELRPHRQEDLLSKLTLCDYDPDADCPRWKEALRVIFQEDDELIAYIRRALGYSLTADTSAQALFLCYGTGRNGKNTVLDTVRLILREYATVAAPRILLTAGSNDHPAMIADLMGARFVPTSEVDEGERLAESLVKRLTGDSHIKARFMHQNPFEFRITFKLWMAVNSKPEISGTDKGIWSRVRVIPFDAFIPPEKRVANLSEILIRDEGPGILNWLVQGCLDWQGAGLQEPARVLAAIEDYRSEQDVFGDYLERCCVVADGDEALVSRLRARTEDLYNRYVEWSKNMGEKSPLTRRKFEIELTRRGFAISHSGSVRYRMGIALSNGASTASDRGDDDATPY
jgi:putative DNA primase/helicase